MSLVFDKLFTKAFSLKEIDKFDSERDHMKETYYFGTSEEESPDLSYDPDSNGVLCEHKTKFVSAYIKVKYAFDIFDGEAHRIYDSNGREIISSAVLIYRCEIDKPKTLFTEAIKGDVEKKFPCTIDFDTKEIKILPQQKNRVLYR
jgi:hypothetical protein